MQKILLPVDIEKLSDKTFKITCDLVQKLDASLVILSVVPFSDKHSHPQLSNLLDMKDEHFVEYAEKIVKDIAERFKLKGIDAQTVLLKGNPADEIIRYSEEEQFDLVIMNTQNINSTKRFFVGSVTNKVVHNSNVPVLIIS